MDTIEYMNRQEQSREDPDEIVLSLTFECKKSSLHALKFFCFFLY